MINSKNSQSNFLEEKISYLKPPGANQNKNFKDIQIIHEYQTKAITRPFFVPELSRF